MQDELTRYLDAPLLVLDSSEANESFNAMKWWTGNMQEFPVLAQLAFETFSIPAMSVEPERVFSGYITSRGFLSNLQLQTLING